MTPPGTLPPDGEKSLPQVAAPTIGWPLSPQAPRSRVDVGDEPAVVDHEQTEPMAFPAAFAVPTPLPVSRFAGPWRRVSPRPGTPRWRRLWARLRGLFGDLGYLVATARTNRAARGELAVVTRQLKREQRARREHLVEMARRVVADPSIGLAFVAPFRHRLCEVEARRLRRAVGRAATEAAIAHIERRRGQERAALGHCRATLADELGAIGKRLDSLQWQLARARRWSAARADSSPVAPEARSVTRRPRRPSTLHSALAARRERLELRIAALTAARCEGQERLQALRARETETRTRSSEQIMALRARIAVEQRGESDAERERDQLIGSLGERLAMERPAPLAQLMVPVEESDVAIATLARRALELRELISSADRAALLRGLAVLAVLIFAAVCLLVSVLR